MSAIQHFPYLASQNVLQNSVPCTICIEQLHLQIKFLPAWKFAYQVLPEGLF